MIASNLKVLHVGAGNLFGGIEILMRTLASRRNECPELEPEYAFCFEGKAAQVMRETGVAVHLISPVRLSRPWSILAARKRFRRLLTERSYDAIILHECWVHTIFAPALSSFRGKRIFWAHDRHQGKSWLDWLVRRHPPDGAIINSQYSAETMPSFFPGVPWRVIYCPVEPIAPTPDSQTREAIRREFDTPPDAVVFVQVGRWEPHKGHRNFFRGLAELKGFDNWICWQVGATQRESEVLYLREVEQLAEQLGISNRIRYLGWQPDLARVFAGADIYCQPNENPEPFGITFVEALSAGLPVVGTTLGGPLEIVQPSCGRLVPPNDSVALGRVLRELIDDSNLRANLGAHGPNRARELCDPGDRIREIHAFLTQLAP